MFVQIIKCSYVYLLFCLAPNISDDLSYLRMNFAILQIQNLRNYNLVQDAVLLILI